MKYNFKLLFLKLKKNKKKLVLMLLYAKKEKEKTQNNHYKHFCYHAEVFLIVNSRKPPQKFRKHACHMLQSFCWNLGHFLNII